MKAWDLKTQTYCDIYNCTGLRNGKDVRIERMIGHLLGWSCAYLLHDTNSLLHRGYENATPAHK